MFFKNINTGINQSAGMQYAHVTRINMGGNKKVKQQGNESENSWKMYLFDFELEMTRIIYVSPFWHHQVL